MRKMFLLIDILLNKIFVKILINTKDIEINNWNDNVKLMNIPIS